MNFIYKINKDKDFIQVYSLKITTTEVRIFKFAGKWEVEHWSGNRNLENTRNYAELILHACDIAEELNTTDNEIVFERLLN